jgi:DnaJ family protein A protein 2
MGFGNRPRGSDSKFYDELGLQRDASQDDIKRAYKKLAMQHHPDRGGSREKFEAVTRAYEVLSDPQQRQSYDQFGEAGVGQEGQAGPSVDPMDLFSQIFGFQGQGGRQGPLKTRDAEYKLEIPLEDLYTGTTRNIKYKRDTVCKKCTGQGGFDPKTCPRCKGTGMQISIQQFGPFKQQVQMPCSDCEGAGRVLQKICQDCRGRGVVTSPTTFPVKIEAGMPDGHEIRFKGMSDEAPGHTAGDVVIRVATTKHPDLTRIHNDLITEKRISLTDALCGFQIEVNHLSGERMTIRSAKGSIAKPGQMWVVPGRGMPRYSGTTYGDLYVRLIIEFPDQVSDDVRAQLLRALGEQPERATDAIIAEQARPNDQQRIESDIRNMSEKKKQQRERGGPGGGQQEAQCAQQ